MYMPGPHQQPVIDPAKLAQLKRKVDDMRRFTQAQDEKIRVLQEKISNLTFENKELRQRIEDSVSQQPSVIHSPDLGECLHDRSGDELDPHSGAPTYTTPFLDNYSNIPFKPTFDLNFDLTDFTSPQTPRKHSPVDLKFEGKRGTAKKRFDPRHFDVGA